MADEAQFARGVAMNQMVLRRCLGQLPHLTYVPRGRVKVAGSRPERDFS